MPLDPEQHELGRKWEQKISRVIQDAGGYVLETARYSKNESEAPAIFGDNDECIIPDLMVFSLGSQALIDLFDGNTSVWIEVKYREKTVSIRGGDPRTGISFQTYKQYIKDAAHIRHPCLRYFYSRPGRRHLRVTIRKPGCQ